MGSIVCQTCEEIIEWYEDEKVSVLYGSCCDCADEKQLDHQEV
ncbi:GapA-binding peptide SR1P [Bacillus shivajii]|nr:GapA-binding peptide SR1P [Bacillus shivajii]UCZ51880.1 GapA-binding peptide SR1P [Bacillus shivajii]